jgi:hypothetical protein
MPESSRTPLALPKSPPLAHSYEVERISPCEWPTRRHIGVHVLLARGDAGCSDAVGSGTGGSPGSDQQLTVSPQTEETLHFHRRAMQREPDEGRQDEEQERAASGHARDVDPEDAVDRVDARLRHRAAHPDAVGGRADDRRGIAVSAWKISANNRRARFYTLTSAGKKQLGVEESRFSQMFGAIMRVMKTT